MTLFFLLGAFVGFIGTSLGLGGGIILTPVILYMYPHMKPEQVTAISLFCIAINATVGSISYLIKKKTHIPSAILFSLASLPGAWLGVQLTSHFERSSFELVFGFFLLFIGLYLIFRKPKSHIDSDFAHWKGLPRQYLAGFIASFFVGVIASFLGIGGGIIHVPLLVETMKFPVHTSIATSHFILAISAIVASIEHFMNGSLTFDEPFVLYIAAGILVGAPLGAKFSSKLKGANVMKLIGGIIVLVAIRFLWSNLT